MAKNGNATVRQLQRTLYQKSKQAKRLRFYSLYDKVWREDVLWEAWRQVKQNKRAPGIDGQAIDEIILQGKEREMIIHLQEALREKRYEFSPVRCVEIPKPKGGVRRLGIATVEDRVVQTAMKIVMEPIFEADFHDCSYGYRPQRNAQQASEAIRGDLYDRAWSVVEIDFKSYFDSIPRAKLITLIRMRIADGSLLKLIQQSLRVGVHYEGKIWPTKVGVPQGSPISPLYSNIYLNLIDQLWHKRGYPEQLGATLHRYADDAILVCRQSATAALEAFESIVQRMDLTINREKTHITKLTEGFDFIGYHFVKRKSPTSGKNSIYIFPTKTSQQKIRHKLKAWTSRRAPIKPAEFVQLVNRMVTGWANYYRHTNASDAFRRLQRFIDNRFRRYLTYRSKGHGFGWKHYPDAKLHAMGLIYIGSGWIGYTPKPAHDG